MNKADSSRLEGLLESKGYSPVDKAESADVIIYNTCSVREHAEQKAMSHVGRLKFLKIRRPEIKICVVGCMAQRKKKEIISSLPHVDLVIGPSTMFRLPRLIENGNKGVFLDTEETVREFPSHVTDSSKNYIEFVPVMKGCNNFCSYCIVPYVRGREQYRKKEEIIAECNKLADRGVIEIMLLGQTVNSHPDFIDILKSVSEINGIKRVRFITSYPGKVNNELIDLVAGNPVLCNYFHVPLQSGSDRILKKMNRNYTVSKYMKIAEYIRKKIPQASISSDFIVGFPGESEEDFQKTLNVIQKIQFDQSFTFKYSPRPLTMASKWKDDIPLKIKKERLSRLNELCTKISLERNKKLEGEILEVISEGNNTGRSEHYKIVFFNGKPANPPEIVKIKVTQGLPHSLKGERI